MAITTGVKTTPVKMQKQPIYVGYFCTLTGVQG